MPIQSSLVVVWVALSANVVDEDAILVTDYIPKLKPTYIPIIGKASLVTIEGDHRLEHL